MKIRKSWINGYDLCLDNGNEYWVRLYDGRFLCNRMTFLMWSPKAQTALGRGNYVSVHKALREDGPTAQKAVAQVRAILKQPGRNEPITDDWREVISET